MAVLPQTYEYGFWMDCYKAGEDDEPDFWCEYDLSFTMQRAYIYDMGILMEPVEGFFMLNPHIEKSVDTYNNWIIN